MHWIFLRTDFYNTSTRQSREFSGISLCRYTFINWIQADHICNKTAVYWFAASILGRRIITFPVLVYVFVSGYGATNTGPCGIKGPRGSVDNWQFLSAPNRCGQTNIYTIHILYAVRVRIIVISNLKFCLCNCAHTSFVCSTTATAGKVDSGGGGDGELDWKSDTHLHPSLHSAPAAGCVLASDDLGIRHAAINICVYAHRTHTRGT